MSNEPDKFVFALVGLPARGKSFLSAKIVTFFNWSGVPARIFNAGSKRRAEEGVAESGRSTFFSSSNSSAVSKRDHIALSTLRDAVDWLTADEGVVAIFDATNTTRARRVLIDQFIRDAQAPIKLIFIESICNNDAVLRENFLQKVRNSPDFKGLSEEDALKDLQLRIQAYENVYETVEDDEDMPYIKIIDLASKVVSFRIWGAIPMRCVQLLMSCHVGLRPVYLARAGHCDDIDDLSHGQWFSDSGVDVGAGIDGAAGPYSNSPRIRFDGPDSSPHGGRIDPTVKMPSTWTCNAKLSAGGMIFAKRLAKYIQEQGHGETVVPFTSTMPRAVQTISALGIPAEDILMWSALGILDTGIFHGLSVQFIKDNMPDEYTKWVSDPLHYRFPGGESILDMNKRLAEVVLEIEHTRSPVAVVSHLSTIQSLVAYFTGNDPNTIPYISVPRHSVLVLRPSIYGWSLNMILEDDLPLCDDA